MSFLSQHKYLIVIAVVIVLGGAWYMLSGSSAPTLTSTSTDAGSSPADQQLVTNLLALRAVKLDGTIFSNPAFLSLKDFSTQIVSEPVGRADPFAPLSSSAATSTTSTGNSQLFTPRQAAH
jgi:hypothetical protein